MEGIVRDRFGVTASGEEVWRCTLTSRTGSSARWISWGATLTELWVPDRSGSLGDVVLGFDDLAAYERNEPYFGCTVGRVANRIAGAHFELDGVGYPLARNDGAHHLHGGRVGFDRVCWRVRELSSDAGPAVRFEHTSPDGDEGYPGNLEVAVTVRFAPDDTLCLEYTATTDAPTLVNLTNHSYWNLARSGDVLGHELAVRAEHYSEPDGDLIPTGRLLPVAGTPLDFRVAKPVGRDIAGVDGGYDHNLVLAHAPRRAAVPAAELRDPVSGRRMTFSTSEPGVQLYTGNFLEGVAGKRGATHGRHAALCLEAQHFPDAIHHPAFAPIVLRPDETYRQRTDYAFSID